MNAPLNHVECPECGKEVDDRAPACPQCGAKIYVNVPGRQLGPERPTAAEKPKR